MNQSKMLPHNSKGFTITEVLVAMTVLSALVALSTTNINSSKYAVETISGGLMAAFSDISLSMTNYQNEKNSMPNGLSDSTFVSYYIFPPTAPDGFDKTYGVYGYNLALQTGQVSPNNGWYVCAKTTVSGANDVKWLAIKQTATNLSPQRFFYNTSCPTRTNMANPASSTTVYVTNWITSE